MNADGWGVGFFDRTTPDRARWRSAARCGATPSFASVAPALRSGCVVAAVRSASVGMPIEPTASAPFTDGRWLLSHNGLVDRAVLPLSRDAGVHRGQRAAGRADLRPRPGRARRHHRRGGRRRPQRPAEHAGRQRLPAARHHLGRHPVGAASPTTASCWPANPTTTTRPGRTSPTGTSSRSPATRRRADPAERIVDDVLAVQLPRRRLRARSPAPRRARRTDADAEIVAAQVVLRLGRQRSVRPDHPAARVLPDPRRGADPSRRGRPRSPRRRGPTPSSSSAAAPRRRPACCWTRCATAAPCAGSSRSTSTPSVLEAAGVGHRTGVPRHRDRRGVRRLRGAPRQDSPRRPPAGRLPRLDDRQPRHPGRAPTSWPRLADTLQPGDSLLLGTDLVKDPDRLVRGL